MDRTKFYIEVSVRGVPELDYLYNSLVNFKMKYPVGYYRVRDDDILRPDMISYKAYKTVKYWWLICYVNRIQNPLVDLVVGQQLRIPDVIDIYDFYKQYKVR